MPLPLAPQRQQALLTFLASLGLQVEAATLLDLAPIEEALSHSSAGLGVNHERLEFLGDAVLRLAASEFLRREHPQLPVGRHAALRAQLVSDRWLAELGQRCGIHQVWHLGAMAAGDRAGRATVLAEISEALIGALYLVWGQAANGPGSLEPVLEWLTPHWRVSTAAYLANPDLDNWKSALQEWSQGQGLGLPAYHCQERSQRHGDPERFSCRVALAAAADQNPLSGEGAGPSRRAAEQAAARAVLEQLRNQPPRQL